MNSDSFPVVRFQRLPHGQDLPLPSYQTAHSAGMDVRAACAISVAPGETVLVPTGLAMALSPGFEAQLRPRSGLAARYGITLLNSPGTIDADYRGEIQVILTNLGRNLFQIARGDRIAQMVIARYEQPQIEEVESLDETARGAGGFGHTGTK